MYLLAHYGGIDEIGLFVVAGGLAIVAIRWAERRARESKESREAEGADETE